MSQTDFQICMTPHMKGIGKTKEERQRDMCVGAKICTHKATKEEAERLCALSAQTPKPPKVKGTRGKGKIDLAKLSSCVGTNLNLEGLNAENLVPRLESAMQTCSISQSGSKPTAKVTYKRFMSKCLKAKEWTGDFRTSYKLIKQCNVEWRAREKV